MYLKYFFKNCLAVLFFTIFIFNIANATDNETCEDDQVVVKFDGNGIDGQDVLDYTVDLIETAQPGATIMLTTYGWTNSVAGNQIVDALNEAVENEVNVKAIVGKTKPVSGLNENIDVIYTTNGKEGDEREEWSCLGTGIMHDKFLIIDKACSSNEPVVLQSSANFTSGMAGENEKASHNNTIVVRNDADLYQNYADYFSDMSDQEKEPDYYNVRTPTLFSSGIKMYVYPRESGDTILSVLKGVTCEPDTVDDTDSIYVAMAFWDKDGSDILDKLVELKDEGCDVQIAVGNYNDSRRLGFVGTSLVSSGIDYKLIPDIDGKALHSKYLLLDAKYGDNAERKKYVFTGSLNYGVASRTKNDEVMLRIDNESVFNQYLDNWELIYSQGYPLEDICASDRPCNAGTGDCDNNNECGSGLHCFNDEGSEYGYGASVDICRSPGEEYYSKYHCEINFLLLK